MLSELANITIKHLENPADMQQNKAKHLQEELQSMLKSSESEHFSRISRGDCNASTGIIYLEILEEISKIARHLENINDRAGVFYGKFPKAHERR